MQHLSRTVSPALPHHCLRALRAAFPQTIPVLAGYFMLGMGYGIYVQSLGLPVWMPMLMGTVVYGGSLEFVLASLLLSAFSPLSAFLMALMIQARHLFYGLAMLERYKGYGLRSFYMIFAMSDETFSITCSAEPPEGVDRGWFMFFVTLPPGKLTRHIPVWITAGCAITCSIVNWMIWTWMFWNGVAFLTRHIFRRRMIWQNSF